MNLRRVTAHVRMSNRAAARIVRASNVGVAPSVNVLTAGVARNGASMSTIARHFRGVARIERPSQMITRAFATDAAEVVPVPSMGDSISEGTVVEWVKAPGEYVEADDVVVVLETDKVSVDVRAPFGGVLSEHLAKIDESVLVGAPLFKLTPQEGGAPSQAAEAQPIAESTVPTSSPAPSAPSGEVVTVDVPSMGDSISEGTVVTIFKNAGDYVKADEPVLVLETDKVSIDVNAPQAGRIVELMTKLEAVVEVGAPLFSMEPGAVDDTVASTPAESAAPSTQQSTQPSPPTTASAAAPTPTAATANKPAPATSESSPNPSSGRFSRNEVRVQMSPLMTRAAQRQKDTQNDAAMLTTFQECDMGNLVELRDQLGEQFEKIHGVKLGFMSSFLKASAMALQKVPAVNAFIDMETKEIVYNDFVDINVAVASEKGVVVPVIRNVENKSIADLEKSLTTLADQARTGSLALEDLSGGTFTIANSGVNGALLGTSMLVSPQSAVMGVHGIKMRPAFHNGKVVPRPMMFLSLTYDHRIIDGREAVTFLKSIADGVSDPRKLLMEL